MAANLAAGVVDALRQDWRFAVRMLVNNPAFALAAILTLALGIGANVALFSVVYGVLLRPLPYTDPDRLILVQAETAVTGTRQPLRMSFFMRDLSVWQQAQAFERPALFTNGNVTLPTGDGLEVIENAIVSAGFFQTVGGLIESGRPLSAEDDALPSVVVSDRLARRLFGDPQRALGRQLSLTMRPYTIVGVASSEFQIPARTTDVWINARFMRTFDPREFGFQMIARARENASLAHINAEVESIAQRLSPAQRQIHGHTVALADQIVGSARRPLAVLFAAVLLVLMVACINLTNLLLARNASREREFAIRVAIGASRRRLAVQALVESAVLALMGAVAGVALAFAIVRGLVRSTSTMIPRLDAVRIDAPTLWFAAGIMLVCGLIAGASPAWLTGRSRRSLNVVSALSASRPHQRIRRVLCTTEWALSFVLLVGAMLLGRSLLNLMRTDLGVSTDHVATASLNVAFGQRPSEAEAIQRFQQVVDRVAHMPGVVATGLGTSLPPETSRIRVSLKLKGDTVDYAAAAVPVTPGYFSALRMRLVKGRFFTDDDDGQHPEVVILTEDTARRFFGAGDVIGRTLSLPRGTWTGGPATSVEATLVGIVANVKYSGLAAPPDDALYRPFKQQPWVAPFIVARTPGDPGSLLRAMRREIVSADPAMVVSAERSLDTILADATAQPRFQTLLLASFTVVALVLAAVGLYGVVAFSVARRTTEIGVRVALGATARRVLMMVLREGITVATVGLTVGVAASLALVRLLAASLYGVAPTDTMSFLLAALVLLVICVLASAVPAWRATRVDPVTALRWN